MGQRTQLEVWLNPTACVFDEKIPHEPTRRIVGEGEVDCFVEELFEVFLGAFVGFTSAAYNRNACLISNPLWSPLFQGLLYSCRVLLIILLGLFLFAFLFLTLEYFLTLVNIDD